MQITVNGNNTGIEPKMNIRQYLGTRQIDLAGVVVEINQKIIKKQEWEITELKDGDIVELISFVGGG
ncbi:MAG: sulfur carrier protein ThiS [Candidatus Margulisiibacteriota bacterium]